MSAGPALAPDAAMVLGIASTAMPFARNREAEAERWLRLLRLHGEVGIALQALGVSETALPAPIDDREDRRDAGEAQHPDAVEAVTEHTVRIARERGAHGVATADVLMAVMHVYGEDFDRVLRAHGTDRDEVLERLGSWGSSAPASAESGPASQL
jgi:ATP-dependent Clp protease ATP-binding subunit ClpA